VPLLVAQCRVDAIVDEVSRDDHACVGHCSGR
jgi:hypothetical protein